MEVRLASTPARIDRRHAPSDTRFCRFCVAAACLLSLLFVSPSSPARINKCDIGGRIVYTDQACPEDSSKPLRQAPLNTTPSRIPDSGAANEGDSRYASSKWFIDHRGYAAALEVSRRMNAPLFIYGYTDWCGYCKRLDRNMLNDARVKAVLAGFVKVKINPEHGASDERLFKGWGGKGYPTLYIQPGPDSAPTRTSGPFEPQNGKWELMQKSAFIAMLESSL